jgi:hypothetical protein
MGERIDVTEAAKQAGITERQMRRWCKSVDSLAIRVEGQWRISRLNLLLLLRLGSPAYNARLKARREARTADKADISEAIA